MSGLPERIHTGTIIFDSAIQFKDWVSMPPWKTCDRQTWIAPFSETTLYARLLYLSHKLMLQSIKIIVRSMCVNRNIIMVTLDLHKNSGQE